MSRGLMASHHLGRARHEFRFGSRDLVVLGAIAGLLATLMFALGVAVGRAVASRQAPAPPEADRGEVTGGGPGPSPRRGVPEKTAADRTDERLTFYRTLTAPTVDIPPDSKPTVEEHIVPREEPSRRTESGERRVRQAPAAQASRAVPAAPRVRRPPSQAPAVSGLTPPAGATGPGVTPTPVAGAPPLAPDPLWTVQVSAFRSRALAEDLRTRLAARGLEAYVLASATEEGMARYRVRVGAYATRAEAERLVQDLRAEPGLNPLVTPRPR